MLTATKRRLTKKVSFIFLTLLLFAAITSNAFAANSAPIAGSVTPINGSSLVNIQAIAATTFSDANGWGNIQYVHLLINSAISATNCFYGYYNQNLNKLYLRNDANSAWLGGYTPGSANIIENSYVKLNCAQTQIIGSGTTLTVKWNITFKSTFTGLKKTYLYVKDDANAYSGWIQRGSWTITNSPPKTGIIMPYAGNINHLQEIIFTATYLDPNTWLDIRTASILFNNSVTEIESVHGSYDRLTNKLYFYDHSQNKWLGGFSPGSDNVIETPWAKLNCKNSTVTGNNTVLAINWAITFKSLFIGTKNSYLSVIDTSGAINGWNKVGSITLPNKPPATGTITPSSGTSNPNTAVDFISAFSDPDGWTNIQYVHLLINSAINGTNCFYGYYNQNLNKLYLRNDANSAWLGGYTPGSANTIENSYVKLNCAQTQIIGSGTEITVRWNITFKATFTGLKNTYLYVKDDANAYSGWIQKGTWTIVHLLSISTNPKIWDIGSTQVNRIITMTQTNKVVVTNNGTGPQTMELRLINTPYWLPSTTPGRERYVLSGIFCNSNDIPQPGNFNQDASSEDVIFAQSKKATNTIFGYSQATANGTNVPAGSIRSLYLQFKSPTITQRKEEQNISVIISCQTP